MPKLQINFRRFVIFAFVTCAINLGLWLAFVRSRPPLDEEDWQFLEKQRPQIVRTPNGGITASLNLCADCLNFALARRAVGGWETVSVKATQAVDVLGYAAAFATFHSLEERPTGTSKSHSDIATAVFCVVSIGQWLALSYFASLSPQSSKLRRSNSA